MQLFFLLKEEGIVQKCSEILTGKSYKVDVKMFFILLYLLRMFKISFPVFLFAG